MNLAALCQRCHNRHDAADRQRNRRLNRYAPRFFDQRMANGMVASTSISAA